MSAATPVRVLLVDDQALFREALATLLEVRDDGRGTTGLSEVGFGLLGLRERASRLGGSLDVVSEPGRGTTVRVAVPG